MSASRKSLVEEVEKSLNQLKHGGQKLTEAAIPDRVYESAKIIVLAVNYDQRYHTKMFDLLLERGKGVILSMADQTILSWQQGLKALLRYPMDLYLAPNRPELKIIKLTTGFYQYNINRKLKDAKDFLEAMGYKTLRHSPSDYILKDTSNLIHIITDVVLLHEELTVTREIVETVANTFYSKSVSGRQIFLHHVLLSRQKSSNPDKHSCIDYLMCGLPAASTESLQRELHNDKTISGRSMAVDSDRASNRKPRKNSSTYLPRGSDMSSFDSDPHQSVTSPPPPDVSQLPPPAMSQSQVLRMFQTSESTPRKMSDSGNESSGSKISFVDSDTPYHVFKGNTYKPVMFSIGGFGQEEELSLGGARDSFQRRGPVRVNSFDSDTMKPSSKVLRHNSSGDILDTYRTPTTAGYSSHAYPNTIPECHQSSNPNPPVFHPHHQQCYHGINNTVGTYQPTSSYHTTSNRTNASPDYRYGPSNSRHDIRRTSEVTLSSARNVISDPNSNSRSNYTKNFQPYGNIPYPYHTNVSTGSTWAGENPQQFFRQMSYDKQISSAEANDMTKSHTGWTCWKCENLNSRDLPGCPKCGELAPWIDTSPFNPVVRGGNQQIQTDSSSNYPLRQTHPPENKEIPWQCMYCSSLNYHNGTVCTECNQS